MNRISGLDLLLETSKRFCLETERNYDGEGFFTVFKEMIRQGEKKESREEETMHESLPRKAISIRSAPRSNAIATN